jgi:hypothetical protein
MFSCTMTFDGDTLTILRPDEHPLTIRKADCERLFPLRGRLVLRDGRSIHISTPTEQLAHCTKRLQWLEQWWPGLRPRVDKANRAGLARRIQLGLASILFVVVLSLLGLAVFEELGYVATWKFLLFYSLVALAFVLPKLGFLTDSYQQPIDLNKLDLDARIEEALQKASPHA